MSCETRSGCEGCPLINLCFPQPENKLLDSGLNSDTISSMGSQESTPVDAFLQQNQAELELSSKLAAEASAVIEEQGGLSVHEQQYKGRDPSECPFLSSMGAAGIKLYEKMQAAESNPSSGPGKSLAERLAEKQAKKQAEQKAETKSTVGIFESSATKAAATSTAEVTKVQQVPLEELARPDVVDAVEISRQIIEEEMKAHSRVQVVTSKPVATEQLQVNKVVEAPVAVKLQPTPIHKTSAETRTTKAEEVKVTVAVAQTDSLPKPSFAESFVPKSNEVVEFVEQEPSGQTIIPVESAAVTNQEITEKLIVENVELPEVGASNLTDLTEHPVDIELENEAKTSEEMANESFAEQESVAAELPSIAQHETDDASEVKTAKALEELSEAYVKLVAEAPGEVAEAEVIEKLRPLCEELLTLMELPSQEKAVKALVQELLSSAALTDSLRQFDASQQLAADELNFLGTHEYKTSVSATLQQHFTGVIKQRVSRFREVSRYILAKIGSPASALNI